MTTPAQRWATLLALPEGDRERREKPFWQSLVETLRWRHVLDAGCGGGFHLRLLRDLGVVAVGLDAALAPLALRRQPQALVGDILAPPLAGSRLDAVICLGNTISLMPTRKAQAEVLVSLAGLLRPGGMVLLQGEDVVSTVRTTPLARLRSVGEGCAHLRVFRWHGKRVQMLVGLVPASGEGELDVATLLPTNAAVLCREAKRAGLDAVALPTRPPGGPMTWWVALQAPAR